MILLGGETLKDIKTKEIRKDIKTLDKSRAISERIKNAAAQTKENQTKKLLKMKILQTQYASDRTEQAVVRVKDKAIYEFNKQGKKVWKKRNRIFPRREIISVTQEK
jgi:hypothetical protein